MCLRTLSPSDYDPLHILSEQGRQQNIMVAILPKTIQSPKLKEFSSESWFHFLCKSVQVVDDPVLGHHISDSHSSGASQDDWNWLRSSIFLRWTKCSSPDEAKVTLIIFSAGPELRDRFRRLKDNSSWQDVLRDPWSLFVMMLDELWFEANRISADIGKVFRQLEKVITKPLKCL